MFKTAAFLPLFNRNLSLWYTPQKLPQAFGIQVFRTRWFHCTATTVQNKVVSCQPRTTWQGEQTLPRLCSPRLVLCQIQRRGTFISRFRRKRKTAQELQKADNVGSHYELVYNVRNGTPFVKLGIAGLNILSVSIVANLCLIACGVSPAYVDVALASPVESSIFVTVNFFICYGLFQGIRCYPVRIYYSELEDKFLAIFVGVHPFSIRPLKIKPGEVKVAPPGKIMENVLPWASHIYATSSQKIVLFDHNFKYPLHFNMLLGYI